MSPAFTSGSCPNLSSARKRLYDAVAAEAEMHDTVAGTAIADCRRHAIPLCTRIRSQADTRADSVTLDTAAVKAGMTTMVDDGVVKCRAGVTSAAEVLRVTAIR